MTTETKISPAEHLLRWLRSLPPVHADLMVGKLTKLRPQDTVKWVKEGRRLVMEERDGEMEQLFGFLFSRLEGGCAWCGQKFEPGRALYEHQRSCEGYLRALREADEED